MIQIELVVLEIANQSKKSGDVYLAKYGMENQWMWFEFEFEFNSDQKGLGNLKLSKDHNVLERKLNTDQKESGNLRSNTMRKSWAIRNKIWIREVQAT